MKTLYALAAASLFALGATLPANAAPVGVTYAITPGAGFAGWGVGATSATGVAGGTMTVVYASGSTVIGGSLGSPATVQNLVMSFTSPGTLIGSPFSTMVIANGIVGSLSGGGFWNFSGATAVAASAIGPGSPTYSQTGTAFLVFSVLGAASIGFSGAGTQMFIGPGVTGSWTIGGLVGTEVSRFLVPEPKSGGLLFGAAAIFAAGSLILRAARRKA